jgi:hypothetical protein
MITLSAQKLEDGRFKLTQTDDKKSVKTCVVAVDPGDGSVKPVTLTDTPEANQKTGAEPENEIDQPNVIEQQMLLLPRLPNEENVIDGGHQLANGDYRTEIFEALNESLFRGLTKVGGDNVEAANDEN